MRPQTRVRRFRLHRGRSRNRKIVAEHGKPLLGLATTQQLLEEIKARGETEPRYEIEGSEMAIGAANLLHQLPGSMLDYRTVESD